uniref:hypothetical protein n=1 Tax=Candidatus Borrarchaeum sp. TaxID=2846742 RepID=UPI00257BA1A4
MSFIVKESIRISPLTNAVISAIIFEFKVETNDFEIINSVDGMLVSKDEKVLSYLVESDPLVSRSPEYS